MAAGTARVMTSHNFIDGKWVPSGSGEMLENRNPSDTDDVIGLFQHSGGVQEASDMTFDFSGRRQRVQIDTADL